MTKKTPNEILKDKNQARTLLRIEILKKERNEIQTCFITTTYF